MAQRTKNSTAVLFTMILHMHRVLSVSGENILYRGFVLEGEPTQKDLDANPIQKIRYHDGLRTVWVLVYSTTKVPESIALGYVDTWKKGQWKKIDMRKTRTNNVIKKA